MSEISVVAKATAKVDCEAALEAELRRVAKASRNEPGCLLYTLHRAKDDFRTFITFERWESREAFELHLKQSYVIASLSKIPELVSESPEIREFEPLADDPR
ncbi:MAG: antibiotic biosynthesis monooxygenase [Elusimicrobia bacterium]|nr:antibiotic biosynthesis monooxygenase [Elusimicrobiota bacterium]